jgi:hypothetical protein
MLLRRHFCYPLKRRRHHHHCSSRGQLTVPRRHHCYPLAHHRHCHCCMSKVQQTMPRGYHQHCHRHCHRRCASKGQSTMLRRHHWNKQRATNGAEVPLSSTGEQGTADKFKVPCHHCASRGQLIAPRRYPPGIRRCHHHASKGLPTVPRRRCQCRLCSHGQGRTNGTIPPLVRGLLDVAKARCVFATNVAANGAATGRTIVKSVIHVAVFVPTTIAKVLNVVIDKHQHGRCFCKIVALTPVVVLAATMTSSPVNKCCQKCNPNQGNKAAGNGAHQGLLPGCIIVIGIVVGGIVVVVGAFDVARTMLDVPVSTLPLSLPTVVASPWLLQWHCCPPRRQGRKAVHYCPRCCTPLCPCPAAMAQRLLYSSSLMPPSCPTLTPGNPSRRRWG